MKELVYGVWAASLVLGSAGWAQAGGYSAGPGLQQEELREVDGGVAVDGGVEPAPFRTEVHDARASPVFTQDRTFGTTRLWVLDPGTYTVEQWWTTQWNGGADMVLQSEFEVGLVPHVQLDLYLNLELASDSAGVFGVAKGGHTGVAAEVRYALGSYWGQIPLNPTLYFEVQSLYYNSPRAEVRLLLADTFFTPRFLAALNLNYEQNVWRDQQSGMDLELKATVGLTYEVVPDVLKLGVEGVFGADSHGQMDAAGRSVLLPVAQLGPSLLLTEPKRRIKLLATVLRGFARDDAPWTSMVIVSTTWGR